MADLLNYAMKSVRIAQYLPNSDEWIHLDRQWLCDVTYTLDTVAFQDFINQRIIARRKVVKEKQKQMVGIRSEFIQALQNSVVFSSKSIACGGGGNPTTTRGMLSW